MKTAQLILNTIIFVTFVTILSIATSSAAYANDCDASVDLQGTVHGNQATITNYSQNSSCNYDATLAIYDSPKQPETNGWIEAQTLIGSQSVNVPAGQTVTISVNGTGPSCYNQADLIRGTQVLTPPVYRDAMSVDVYKVKDDCTVPVTVTPTTLAYTGDSIVIDTLILAGVAGVLGGIYLRRAKKSSK